MAPAARCGTRTGTRGGRARRAWRACKGVCGPRAPPGRARGSAHSLSSSEHTVPGAEPRESRGFSGIPEGSPAQRAEPGCGMSGVPAHGWSWPQGVQPRAVPAGVQISLCALWLWLAQCVPPKQHLGTRAPPCCLCALPALPEGVPCPIWQRVPGRKGLVLLQHCQDGI